jgi:hypothetical protein
MTLKDVRRTLEADLGLEHKALDEWKEYVSAALDSMLQVCRPAARGGAGACCASRLISTRVEARFPGEQAAGAASLWLLRPWHQRQALVVSAHRCARGGARRPCLPAEPPAASSKAAFPPPHGRP